MTSTAVPARRVRRLSHSSGFWVVAIAFAIVMAYSTVPTPLYALYQQRDGFPTVVVTVVFAAYAVGVAVSLYLAGHVSDWLGRRRIILIAILVEIVSALLFLGFESVPVLIVARFICGVGIGMLTATATAHLGELRGVARPSSGIAGVIASVANLGGLALGPLVGGILASVVREPLVTPYAVFLVLLVLAALAVALVPETVERREERRPYRPQRVAIPADARGEFVASAAGAFVAFAMLGLFSALAPTILGGIMHETSRVVVGAVAFAPFAAAALGQAVTTRLRPRSQLVLATGLMVAGVVLLAVAVLSASLPLLVASAAIGGGGVGIMFRSALGVAGSLAPAGRRGEVIAAVFLVAYLGLALPALAIGIALIALPLVPVLLVFGGAVLVLVALSAPRMIGRAARE